MFFNKLLTLSFVALFILSAPAFAKRGTESGGGGDASEERVNEIRSDILKWVEKGGAKDLVLPKSMLISEYEESMIEILQAQKVVIGFVEKDDELNEELQVTVSGVPKTCRGFISKSGNKEHIICNIGRFRSVSDTEQYVLIHHEYAGLVDIEQNEGAASDYQISSQISEYLTQQTVLKLAVKKSCDNVSRAKKLALYIINDNLKYFNTTPNNKTSFTEKEIFGNALIETTQDILDRLEESRKLSKSVKQLKNKNLFLSITQADIVRNLVSSNSDLDSPLKEMGCSL